MARLKEPDTPVKRTKEGTINYLPHQKSAKNQQEQVSDFIAQENRAEDKASEGVTANFGMAI